MFRNNSEFDYSFEFGSNCELELQERKNERINEREYIFIKKVTIEFLIAGID
jgi:hypothetical protein